MKQPCKLFGLALVLALVGPLPVVAQTTITSGACNDPTNPDNWQYCTPPPSCSTPAMFSTDSSQCMKDMAAMCDQYNESVPVAGSFAQSFCNDLAAFTYPPECSPTNGGQHPKACQAAAVAECKRFRGGGFPFQDMFCSVFLGTFPAPADGVPAPPPDTWPVDGPCNPIDPASWGWCAPPPSCAGPGFANNPAGCQRDMNAICDAYVGVTGTFGGLFCQQALALPQYAESCSAANGGYSSPQCLADSNAACKAYRFQGLGPMPMQAAVCDAIFAGQAPNPDELPLPEQENSAPSAGLAADRTTGDAPLTVNFTVTMSDPDLGDSTRYVLDFGDGTANATGTASGNVSHTYATPGNFDAILVVSDSQGETATDSVNIDVGENHVPVAALSGPASVAVGEAASFDASASSDADGDELDFVFDFGDGSTAGPGAGDTATHAYGSAGDYTVTVSVTDGRGGSDTATRTVTVTADEPDPTPVHARLSADKTEGEVPLTVNFNATGSTGPEGATLDYTFVFGDGTQSARLSTPWASHEYDAAGTYEAYVIVTDGGSQSDVSDVVTITATTTVVVTPGTQTEAKLAANPTSGGVPLTVQFDGSASTAADGRTLVSYAFNFGDGTATVSGTKSVVSHVYTEPGTYTATLTITDSQDKTSQDTVEVTVVSASKTVAQLRIVGPRTGPAPLSVTFDGSDSVAAPGRRIETYTFDFGDGSPPVTVTRSADAANVTHVYQSAGTFQPTLTVTDSQQASSKAKAAAVDVAAQAPVSRKASRGGGLGLALLLPLLGARVGRRRAPRC